ncbi:MAG TPA: hypothetical protein VNJ46_03710 [Gaiellaceae bacterium]|nr:hypothetical protein [Gaiellaceae bacterium]
MTLTRGRVRLVLGLAGLVLAAAVAALLVRETGGGRARLAAVEVRAEVSPRAVLFGDTVRARVDVFLDAEKVDPRTVRVAARFAPWQPVGPPERERLEAGSLTRVRTTYHLRCLASACAPGNRSLHVRLPAGRVLYGRGGPGERIAVHWPPVVVYTRVDPALLEGPNPLAAPWRAELTSLPDVSYRAPPAALAALALAAGACLLAAAAVLAYGLLPRPAPVVVETPPPPRALTPLERALALLEAPDRADGVADRRRALELIAEEAAGWGDTELARTARVLAWSESSPDAAAAGSLAAAVRARLRERGDA